MNQLQLSNEAWHSEITQFRRPMHMDRESVDVLLCNQLQLSNEAWHSEITQFRRPMHMDRESVDVLLCNCELA